MEPQLRLASFFSAVLTEGVMCLQFHSLALKLKTHFAHLSVGVKWGRATDGWCRRFFFGKFWQSTFAICRLFPLNSAKRGSHNSLKISSHETPHWGGWRHKTFCHKTASRCCLLSRIVVIFFSLLMTFWWWFNVKKGVSMTRCISISIYLENRLIIRDAKPIGRFLGSSKFRCFRDEVVTAIFTALHKSRIDGSAAGVELHLSVSLLTMRNGDERASLPGCRRAQVPPEMHIPRMPLLCNIPPSFSSSPARLLLIAFAWMCVFLFFLPPCKFHSSWGQSVPVAKWVHQWLRRRENAVCVREEG